MPQYRIAELSSFLTDQKHSCSVVVDGNQPIDTPCSLSKPRENGVCFYSKKRWTNANHDLKGISLILISSGIDDQTKEAITAEARSTGTAVLITGNPRLAFMQLVDAFFVTRPEPGIHQTATVPDSCHIDPTATVCAGVRLDENTRVGPRTIISENCVILAGAHIGADCYIGPGTSIGQPGFGYERDECGTMVHFPHVGSIQIGNRVEIGSNTCIDRGTLDDTIIEDGVKIDNLCHISHNVILHKDAVVIANSMIGGSVSIGPRAWVAPSASIINGVSVGADTTIGMCSSVTKPIASNVTVLGVPALEIGEFLSQKKKLKRALDAFDSEN